MRVTRVGARADNTEEAAGGAVEEAELGVDPDAPAVCDGVVEGVRG